MPHSSRTDPTRPYEIDVDERAATAVLPGWDYADAFACSCAPGRPRDAMTAARRMLPPAWAPASSSGRRLLAARDLVVRPFGLRPAAGGDVLLFPVLEEAPDRVVTGIDDRHLDFRVIVTVSSEVVRCMTVVRRHGRLGRLYFAVVGPFHRRLVPRLLVRSRDEAPRDKVAAP